MGTNYYAYDARCDHCGRGEKRHVGKSSHGWCFSLRIYPEDGLTTWAAWKAFLVGKHIEDEYGERVTFAEMVKTVEDRRSDNPRTDESARRMGYPSWDAYYADRNSYAVPGPNNLSRHRICGRLCVGHGEGTWDYMAVEFS